MICNFHQILLGDQIKKKKWVEHEGRTGRRPVGDTRRKFRDIREILK